MKKLHLYIILGIAILSTSLLFGIKKVKKVPLARSEEYAIVSVYQKGKKNFISVTVGSESSEEKEYQKAKNDKKYDMAPIMRELEILNARGYELHSSSTAIVPLGQQAGGLPFYTFTLVRKL
jgi:hypothetical protein